MENYIAVIYKEDFKSLLEIRHKAIYLHSRIETICDLNKIADAAIIQLAKDFSENDILDDEQPEKLGYAFSWLKKLKCSASDDEREEILKDWLKEISEKKNQQEND